MKEEFILIRGRLKTIKRAELEEKIISANYNLQKTINKKTTIIVEGIISAKNKRKYAKHIKVMSEQDFLKFLEKDNTKEKKVKKESVSKYFKIFSVNNILRILSIVMIIQSFRLTDTFMALFICIIASLFILPDISNKIYKNIVFKITTPIVLFMVAFAFNFEKEKSQIYGTWYVDTLTLKIDKNEIKLDIIDSSGRRILNGKIEKKDGKTIIDTEYKKYYFKYDDKNDSLCYMKNKKECSYYLKRIN